MKVFLIQKGEAISIQEVTDLQFLDVLPSDPSGELLLDTEEVHADSQPDIRHEVS